MPLPEDATARRRLRALLADTRPLRTTAYRRLWLAGIVTVVGTQMSVVAVPVQIYALTGSSAYVGLAGLFGLAPFVAFGIWGGALADAIDRRTVLMITGSGLTASALGLWALAALHVGNVWLVLILYAVQQAFTAVNQTTRGAVLPRLLPRAELPAANTLNMMVFLFGAIVGPLLAGALLPVVGIAAVYLLEAVALTPTLWANWRLPGMPPLRQATPNRAGVRDVIAGFAYVGQHKVLLVSFLVDIIAMGAGMPRAVFPEMAVRMFGDPPTGGPAMGWLYASMAIGALVGGLFSGWLHRIRRQGVAVTAAICVWGLAVTAFGLMSALWLAVLFMALGGAADLVSSVFRSTMLQVVATDEMRGRMQGVFVVVIAGGPRLADVWHGPAAAAIGPSAAATIGGVAVVVLTVLVVAASREFWRYRST